MNGLSVLGQKADRNLQIEIEFKPEVQNYKFISPLDTNIPLKPLILEVFHLHSMC